MSLPPGSTMSSPLAREANHSSRCQRARGGSSPSPRRGTRGLATRRNTLCLSTGLPVLLLCYMDMKYIGTAQNTDLFQHGSVLGYCIAWNGQCVNMQVYI